MAGGNHSISVAIFHMLSKRGAEPLSKQLQWFDTNSRICRTSRVPDFNHLHTFGCPAYVLMPELQEKKKIDKQAQRRKGEKAKSTGWAYTLGHHLHTQDQCLLYYHCPQVSLTAVSCPIPWHLWNAENWIKNQENFIKLASEVGTVSKRLDLTSRDHIHGGTGKQSNNGTP